MILSRAAVSNADLPAIVFPASAANRSVVEFELTLFEPFKRLNLNGRSVGDRFLLYLFFDEASDFDLFLI